MSDYQSMTSTSPGGLPAAVIAQIKAERAALDMPIGELARRVGIAPRSITRYLNGEREITMSLVEQFAHALEMDFKTLLRRAVERQEEAEGIDT